MLGGFRITVRSNPRSRVTSPPASEEAESFHFTSMLRILLPVGDLFSRRVLSKVRFGLKKNQSDG